MNSSDGKDANQIKSQAMVMELSRNQVVFKGDAVSDIPNFSFKVDMTEASSGWREP